MNNTISNIVKIEMLIIVITHSGVLNSTKKSIIKFIISNTNPVLNANEVNLSRIE